MANSQPFPWQATAAPLLGSLATQIARAREDIQNSRAASVSL